jgi:cystathionine gamma-synthase
MTELGTSAIHGREERDKPYHSLITPICTSSTFTFEDMGDVSRMQEEYLGGEYLERQEYGRYGNPTQYVTEQRLAALEGAEAAILVASGMYAITASLLALLSNGDHMILTNDCYRRTRGFCSTYLSRWGVETTMVPACDIGAIERALRPNTKVVFTEIPTNPWLRVIDLEALVGISQRHGARLIADSTLATPCNLRPLSLGADLVIHSGTKYLGGHHDLLAGVILGEEGLVNEVRELHFNLGGVVAPQTAYNLLRGLKTLELRVQHHNAGGMAVARFLESHPKVRRVYYPGLPSHPDHEVAMRSLKGFGGMVSFEIDGTCERTSAFVDALRIPFIGPSFGGTEALVIQPAIQTYFGLSPTERAELGITDQLVRYAVGLEDPTDLIQDLAQALESI